MQNFLNISPLCIGTVSLSKLPHFYSHTPTVSVLHMNGVVLFTEVPRPRLRQQYLLNFAAARYLPNVTSNE